MNDATKMASATKPDPRHDRRLCISCNLAVYAVDASEWKGEFMCSTCGPLERRDTYRDRRDEAYARVTP